MKTIALITLMTCTAAFGTTYLETFPDPLGDWQAGWLYQNTNMESHYFSGGNCDANYRGNQPEGIWISDNQGCGNEIIQSPVRIDFAGGFGDDGVLLAFDLFTCVTDVTLNIYDKNGALVVSDPIPSNCWNWSSYSYPLTNGISAFELAYTGGQVEGNTSIDNVLLETEAGGPPVICFDFDPYCDGLELGKNGKNIFGYWRNTDCAGTDVEVVGRIVGNEGRVKGDVGGYTWGFLIDGLPLDGTLDMYQQSGGWNLWIDELMYNDYNGPCLFDESSSISTIMVK